MTTLAQCYPEIDWQHVSDISFAQLIHDSRQVQLGDAFVLLQSHSQPDSVIADYAYQVSDRAALILAEVQLDTARLQCPYLYLPQIRDVLGSLTSAWLTERTDQPVTLPDCIAVTGTNGKTTISHLLAQLLTQTHQRCAIIGTAGLGIYPTLQASSHTSLDVMQLHRHVVTFAQAQADVLVVEASSHGLDQQRLQGLPISIGIYTNLSRDHLDYHHTMDAYATAKSQLFRLPDLAYAIINGDDDYASVMLEAATQNPNHPQVWRYGYHSDYEFFIKQVTPSQYHTDIELVTPQGTLQITSPLLGEFNVLNLVAAIAALQAHAIPLATLKSTIDWSDITPATGRMQRIAIENGDQPDLQATYLVDYAHTPDALDKALINLKPLTTHQQGKLWVVFGCGGNRDRGKRPLMLQAALRHADAVIITSDNPRDEHPQHIIDDMVAEYSQTPINWAKYANKPEAVIRLDAVVQVIVDRATAIGVAVDQAKNGDVVLVAGKGHETYQEIKGIRYDFDDAEVLTRCINQSTD